MSKEFTVTINGFTYAGRTLTEAHEAYARAVRNGTAPTDINCPSFIPKCGPRSAPDL